MYNFIYSSSDAYAPYCVTSITTLLKNNPDLTDAHIFVLSNAISDKNIRIMKGRCNEYKAKLSIINCADKIMNIEAGGGTLNFNISSFLRIFIDELIPDEDKALFIDSDTLIKTGIKELYDTDISDYVCAMSYNMPIYSAMLNEALLKSTDGYYNAGVILLNLKKWRENDVQKRILDFYYANGGNFPTDDQSIINAIVSRECYTLDYKYNAMIGTFYWSYSKFCKMNTDIGCKSRDEYENARRNPVIIHFNGPGVRPWEKWCAHPYTKEYRCTLRMNYPEFELVSGKSRMRMIAQYFKHTIIDRMEMSIFK